MKESHFDKPAAASVAATSHLDKARGGIMFDGNYPEMLLVCHKAISGDALDICGQYETRRDQWFQIEAREGEEFTFDKITVLYIDRALGAPRDIFESIVFDIHRSRDGVIDCAYQTLRRDVFRRRKISKPDEYAECKKLIDNAIKKLYTQLQKEGRVK